MSENSRVNTYIGALQRGADRLGLNLSDSVSQALATHDTLMARWARRINLTTIVDPEQAAVLHGLDCLLFAEAFDLEDTSQVVDVGSGAGFPGIVLAAARPARHPNQPHRARQPRGPPQIQAPDLRRRAA